MGLDSKVRVPVVTVQVGHGGKGRPARKGFNTLDSETAAHCSRLAVGGGLLPEVHASQAVISGMPQSSEGPLDVEATTVWGADTKQIPHQTEGRFCK